LRTHINFHAFDVSREILVELAHVEHLGKSRFPLLRGLGLACRFICARRRFGRNGTFGSGRRGPTKRGRINWVTGAALALFRRYYCRGSRQRRVDADLAKIPHCCMPAAPYRGPAIKPGAARGHGRQSSAPCDGGWKAARTPRCANAVGSRKSWRRQMVQEIADPYVFWYRDGLP
jgi:hypothetical protein